MIDSKIVFKVIPKVINIRIKNISDDFLVLTFVHECVHLITPFIKNESEYNDHSDEFYKKYSEILRYLEDMYIFILKSVTNVSKFSIKNLKRLDRIDLINNKITMKLSNLDFIILIIVNFLKKIEKIKFLNVS